MLLPEIDNVTYLNSTGTYELTPQIGVGVLAIQDIMKTGSSNASNKINSIEQLFPKATQLKTKYKIALYHGIVENNKAFEGYDVAMLGDVHIQIINGKDINTVKIEDKDQDVHAVSKSTFGTDVPWGYAGSMIRQNVGESIEGHGFLIWDLEARNVTSHHITNIVDLAAAECEQEIVRGTQQQTTSEPQDKKTTPCVLQNTPEMWEKYTSENGKVKDSGMLIAQPENLILPNIVENEIIQKKVDERNVKIKKKLEAYVDSIHGNIDIRHPFRILKINWDYLLCYGADNQFYFNKLDGKVSTISGRNGHGKTSFLEIILLALYGQGFPSRANKNNITSIINIHKPTNAHAQATVTLQIDNMGMVKISRAFIPTLKPTPSSNKNFSVEIWDQDKNKWCNVVIGRTLVDKWVDTNVGSIESFLLSCMVSQNADCDFFSLSPSDQKEMLDNSLSIDTHSKFMDLLKETRLGYQALADLVSSALASVSKQLPSIHNNHLERIAILDEQIASGSEVATNFAHIGEIHERQYYIDLVTKKFVGKGRSVDNIIYEMEQIKRQTTSRNSSPIIKLEKSEEWYQNELDSMPEPPTLPKIKVVPYNEKLFVELQESTCLFDSNNGFDIGPYNDTCECCNSRRKALDARTLYSNYVNQWWAKKTFLENALSSMKFEKLDQLKIELAEAKSHENTYNNAKQILDSYDLIQTAIKNTALKIERGKLFHEYEALMKIQKEHYTYSAHLDNIQEKLKMILDVTTCMENYINWLYIHNVIPLVEKYTNEIMNLIDPNLKLRGSMNEKGFEWSISTVPSATYGIHPTIEKASGFQRFICGLAVRIALGTIGASGIKPRQLFLDEGFTSCDSTNLSRVPDFLTMLLQLYDSILLVTHLEDLKDFCIESTIQIGRDNESGTSFLR